MAILKINLINLYGHEVSTLFNAVSIYPGPSTARFVISAQKEPAPTSGGIKSDASNLNAFALKASLKTPARTCVISFS